MDAEYFRFFRANGLFQRKRFLVLVAPAASGDIESAHVYNDVNFKPYDKGYTTSVLLISGGHMRTVDKFPNELGGKLHDLCLKPRHFDAFITTLRRARVLVKLCPAYSDRELKAPGLIKVSDLLACEDCGCRVKVVSPTSAGRLLAEDAGTRSAVSLLSDSVPVKVDTAPDGAGVPPEILDYYAKL